MQRLHGRGSRSVNKFRMWRQSAGAPRYTRGMNLVSEENKDPLTLAAAIEGLRAATGYPWTNRRLISTVVHRQIPIYALEQAVGEPSLELVELRAAEVQSLLFSYGRNARFIKNGNVMLQDRLGALKPSTLPPMAHIRITWSALKDVQRVWDLGVKGAANAYDLPSWMTKHFLAAGE